MREPKEIKRGDLFRRNGRNYKVLGVVDGYVVYRLKGCSPGISPAKEMLNGKHGWEDLQDDAADTGGH